jgi:hypothetical protein
MAWTVRAYIDGYVRLEGEGTYFADMPNGNYLATGVDVHGKRIERRYVVNDTKDYQSKWAMWNDYCGRFGLIRLYHLPDNGGRVLLWHEYGR